MYTPHTPDDIAAMLDRIGVSSIDDLMRVPAAIALKEPLAVPPGLPEMELQRLMGDYAERNDGIDYVSFLGAGSYRHYIPPVIAGRSRCAASF